MNCVRGSDFLFFKMSDPVFNLTPETKETIKKMMETEAGKAVRDQLREKLKIIGAKMKESASPEDKDKYVKELQDTVSSTLGALSKDLKMQAEKLEEAVKNADIFTPNYIFLAIAALLITLFLGLLKKIKILFCSNEI